MSHVRQLLWFANRWRYVSKVLDASFGHRSTQRSIWMVAVGGVERPEQQSPRGGKIDGGKKNILNKKIKFYALD